MKYDSFWDTMAHIRRVQELLFESITNLQKRAKDHDRAKLEDPEKGLFDEMTPKLKDCTYGSDQYRGYLSQLKPALDHHYRTYDHHPEHFKNGIQGMSLLSLLEMLCDWKAAGERHNGGSLEKSFEVNAKRFGIAPEVMVILRNTAEELGMFSGSKPENPFEKYTIDPDYGIPSVHQSVSDLLVGEERVETWFNNPYPFSESDRRQLPKIMLALQYCPLDYGAAMRLLEFILKLEKEKREDVLFMVSYRNDAKPPPSDLWGRFGEIFPRSMVVSSNRGSRGHPAGCNGLWLDTMVNAADIGYRSKIDGVFTFEPDCVPIRRDWIDRIRRDWKIATANKRTVIGHLMPSTEDCPEHVNGNMLIHSQILRGIPQIPLCPPNIAWDIYSVNYFRPHWVHSDFIRNRYHHTNVSTEQILEDQERGTAMIHGVKDDSVIKIFEKIPLTGL
jgi:hypothetical protein